jgi:hypothetical protein
VEGVEGGSFIIDDPARATAMAIFRCILGGGSKPQRRPRAGEAATPRIQGGHTERPWSVNHPDTYSLRPSLFAHLRLKKIPE